MWLNDKKNGRNIKSTIIFEPNTFIQLINWIEINKIWNEVSSKDNLPSSDGTPLSIARTSIMNCFSDGNSRSISR